MAKTAKKTAAPAAKTDDWIWTEEQKGVRWTTNLIPPGGICTARVQRTFSKSGVSGKFGYCAYRDGQLLGMRPDAEAAMALCRSGKPDPRRDAVTDYVDQHPGEVPPFLLLTTDERRAARAQYPYAVPSAGAVQRAEAQGLRRAGAADLQDLGTRALLRELEAKEKRAGGGAGQPTTTRRAKKAALEDLDARVLIVGGVQNPAKAGTKRFARYDLILSGAKRGDTVRALLAAGANQLTLAKCVSKGYVELKGEK